jgi:hypothetical protein
VTSAAAAQRSRRVLQVVGTLVTTASTPSDVPIIQGTATLWEEAQNQKAIQNFGQDQQAMP